MSRARMATPSEVREAEPPVEAEPNPRQTVRMPQAVDPATAAALASLRPFVDEARVRQEQIKAASRLGGGTLIQPGSPMPPRPSSRMSRRTLMGVQPPAFPPRSAPESDAGSEVAAEVAHPSSIAPVEQPSAAKPRARSSWVAWAVASVVVAVGVGFYAFAYVPLEAELARARRDSASRAQQQGEAVRTLQENLDRTRSDLQHRRAAAAQPEPAPQEPVQQTAKPEKPARREPAIGAPPRVEKQEPVVAAERPAHAAKPKAKPKAEPAEPAEPKSNRGVDLEAAAAATAALEAQYGSTTAAPKAAEPASEEPKAAEPAAAAPKAAEPVAAPKAAEPAEAAPRPSREPLLDVENDPSDDPLEGL